MRIVFAGTPEFAVPSLQRLSESCWSPSMVITQPDRPRGRGHKPTPSPVKTVAIERGLPIYQPEKFNSPETIGRLKELGIELGIVVAYSAKIGQQILELPKHGWLNLHPSLLPEYRGAAPLQWALMDGKTETGITTFFLNQAWDAGEICLQEKVSIQDQETYGDLSKRCAILGADLVLRSVELIAQGKAPHIPQDDSLATFAPLLKPEDSILNWNQSAIQISNRARGLSPVPGLFTYWEDLRLLIHACVPVSADTDGKEVPGTVLKADKEGLWVQTGEGFVAVQILQPQGKKPMSARDFLNGYPLKPGVLLFSPQQELQ